MSVESMKPSTSKDDLMFAKSFIEKICHLSNVTENRKNTLLHFTVRFGNSEKLIQLLIDDDNTDVNALNEKNETPLHVAAKIGREEIVNLLVKHLMKPKEKHKCRNIIDDDGLSIFHIFCMSQNLNYIKKFLNNEVATTKDTVLTSSKLYAGYNALHFAAEFYRLDILQFLIDDCDVDVNGKAHNGMTALHLVCKLNIERLIYQAMIEMDCANFYENFQIVLNDRLKMIDLLLRRGCEIHIEDNFGNVALAYVMDKQCLFDYIDTIRSNRTLNDYELKLHQLKNYKTRISSFIEYVRYKIVKLLLNCDENAVKKGFTRLHMLAHSYDLSKFQKNIIQILVEDCDEDVNTFDNNFSTSLHVAAQQNNLSFIKSLLGTNWSLIKWDKRINVDAQDDAGNTALHYTCLSSTVNVIQSECFKMLVDFGADFTIHNNDGLSVLSIINDKLSKVSDYELFKVVTFHVYTENVLDTFFEILDQRYLGYDFEPLIVPIWNHIEKLMISNCFFIDETNNSYIKEIYVNFHNFPRYIQNYKEFEDSCIRDVVKMKETRINKYFTLYDLLIKDIDKITIYTENEDLRNALQCNDFNLRLPQYRQLLEARFIRSFARKKLLDQAKISLRLITKLDIPEPCLERIFYYLSDNNLRDVNKASEYNFKSSS